MKSIKSKLKGKLNSKRHLEEAYVVARVQRLDALVVEKLAAILHAGEDFLNVFPVRNVRPVDRISSLQRSFIFMLDCLDQALNFLCPVGFN